MKAHRLVTVLLVLILSVGLVLLDRGDVEDARDSVLAHPSTSELRQQWLDQRYGELESWPRKSEQPDQWILCFQGR